MLSSNSSAEIISSNEDLLSAILLRLPVKSLLRFKCVSKRWLSLISHPLFSRRHTLDHPFSQISGIFFRTTPMEFGFLSLHSNPSNAPFQSLDFAHDPTGIKILQSCNGLVLCSSYRNINHRRSYYIYNPTTNRFFTLPSIIGESSTTIFGVNLAFDPSKSPHYKVVCVRSTVPSVYLYQIELYSSEIGAWRLSGSPFAAPFDMIFDNGVFWNGGIHWISPTRATMYFNVDKETMGKMPAHPVLGGWGKRRFRYFGECRGHLHLVEIFGPQATQFKVFELEKDYSKWVVKYEVDIDSVITAFPETVHNYLEPCQYYAFFIVMIVREEEEEESSLLLHIPGKVVSYRLKDKTINKVYEVASTCPRKQGFLQFGWFDSYPYIESLASV